VRRRTVRRRTPPRLPGLTGIPGTGGPLACAAALTAALVTGCSAERGDTATTTAPVPASEQLSAEPGSRGVGVSPGGVTTRVDAPAESTEEQYAQACMVAKEWMNSRGGDPQTLVEPYLKEVQSSTETGRATFQKTWPELSGAQQAALIIAVQAAADGGC